MNPVETIDALGQMLVDRRNELDLTQKQLADSLGWHERVIQRYEATKYNSIKFSRLKKVVGVLWEKQQQKQ